MGSVGKLLPFWVCAAAVLAGAGVLGLTSRHLSGIDVAGGQERSDTGVIEEDELEQATAVTVGNDS